MLGGPGQSRMCGIDERSQSPCEKSSDWFTVNQSIVLMALRITAECRSLSHAHPTSMLGASEPVSSQMSATATMRFHLTVAQITGRCTVQVRAAFEAATSLCAAPAVISSAPAEIPAAGDSADSSGASSFAAPARVLPVLHGQRSVVVETAEAKVTMTPQVKLWRFAQHKPLRRDTNGCDLYGLHLGSQSARLLRVSICMKLVTEFGYLAASPMNSSQCI